MRDPDIRITDSVVVDAPRASRGRSSLLVRLISIYEFCTALPLIAWGILVLSARESVSFRIPEQVWMTLGGLPLIATFIVTGDTYAATGNIDRSDWNQVMALLRGVSRAGGVAFILCAILAVGLGIGLWSLQRWARRTALVLGWCNLVVSVLFLIADRLALFWLLPTLVFAYIVIVLTRSAVRSPLTATAATSGRS